MKRILIATTALTGLLFLPAVGYADDGENASQSTLEKRVEQLEAELAFLRGKLLEKEDKEQSTADAPHVVGTAVAPQVLDDKEGTPQATEVSMAMEPVPPRAGVRLPGVNRSTFWHLAGYADAGLVLSDDLAGEGGDNTFVTGNFSMGFHFQYRDFVLVEAELEASLDDDGETALELEYSQIDIILSDYATLVVGKYLSPIGQFQERLHPSWINKMADHPAGFGHDGAQPESEVGIQLRGGISVGDRSTLTYALSLSNGPRLGSEGNIEYEGFHVDDNSNKAFSGRIGFLPVPYLEIGASFSTSKVNGLGEDEAGEEGEEASTSQAGGEELEPTDADVFVWGVDAAFTRGPWDARVEYLNIDRDPIVTALEGEMTELGSFSQTAWYAQIAYRLSGITDSPVLGNFEPAFRYGEHSIDGVDEFAEENSEKRYDIGLNYWIAPSMVVRGVAQWREFTKREEGEDNSDMRYLFQTSYGF